MGWLVLVMVVIPKKNISTAYFARLMRHVIDSYRGKDTAKKPFYQPLGFV